MTTTILPVNLSQSTPQKYKVLVGEGLFKKIDQQLRTLKSVSRYIIIADKQIERLFGGMLCENLRAKGLRVDLISFPAGERYKNEMTKMKLDHALLRKKCGRDTMVIALGGGVVGDMAGFVAATYMRGIPYVHMPTSLLAMVDSSIGGKVGIDTPYGKNLIGAFCHPEVVIADMDCLKKLPKQQLMNGLMEVVKIFLTSDRENFEYVMKNLPKILKKDSRVLQKVIARAVQLKIDVVSRDEKEGNERMVLNFGHTIGHALEYLSHYHLLHGFAVAFGVLVESKISELMGILSAEDYVMIEESFRKLGVHPMFLRKFAVNEIVKATRSDKKSRNGKVKYVLIQKVGQVYVKDGRFGHEVDPKIVKKALQSFLILNC